MAIVIDNLRVAAYLPGKSVGEVVDYHSFGPCTLVPCLGLRHRCSFGGLNSGRLPNTTRSELLRTAYYPLERSGDALIIAQLR